MEGQEARQELLSREATEAQVPQDAGVVVVATNDGWGTTYNFPQDAYNTMVPDFREGDFAAGLVTGAREIQGEPAAQNAQTDPDGGAGGLLGGGLLLLAAVAGALLLFRNRRAKKRRMEEERRSAEEEFADLTVHLNEFDEKERLTSGYLEAQRPLLDRRTEKWVETKISDAKTTGFAREFDEAASRLTSDPIWARERLEHGRNLLAESMQKLHEAERTMDDYRAADEALDGKLRASKEEIRAAEEAEETARAEGVAVEPLKLRPEYDLVAREAADRASRRDEFDPRHSLAAVEALTERARGHRKALQNEISARDALPDERYATKERFCGREIPSKSIAEPTRERLASSARPPSERYRIPESFPRACSKPKGIWIEQPAPRRQAASAKLAPCCREQPNRPKDDAVSDPAEGGHGGSRPQEARGRGEAPGARSPSGAGESERAPHGSPPAAEAQRIRVPTG